MNELENKRKKLENILEEMGNVADVSRKADCGDGDLYKLCRA